MSDAAAPTGGKNPPVKKREIFGWAMYDFANSSYTTVVISLVYSAFFTAHIVPEGGPRDTYWSVAIILSTIVAIILSPLVGAICDFTGRKKRYLGYTTIVCALGTMALFFAGPGNVWMAVLFIAISNAGFMLGESFCGSFLTDLATKDNMGKISGLGWGLGYFGGLVSVALVMFGVVTASEAEQTALYITQNQQAMLVTGVFFALAAVPTFLFVRERAEPHPDYADASMGDLMRAGIAELLDSYKLVRQYDVLFKFFLAFTVYMAGLEVIIKFVGIYANQELGLEQGELVVIFLALQISAAVGALAFGVLEGWLGPKRTVLLTIAWWIMGCLAILFLQDLATLAGVTPATAFFPVALIAGAGIGSIQSSSRAVVGLLSPEERSAQMFGFWGMFSRVAIILGMTFGPVSDMLGRRPAMVLVIGFFVVGGLMLWRVPIQRGIDEAHAADAAA